MRPKCRSSGKDLVLLRQEGAAGIDHVDAGQIVLPRDVLRAQMFFHRHRIIGAALDGGIVGDNDAFAARDPADAGDRYSPNARRRHRGRWRRAATIRETRCRDRSAGRRADAPASCRAKCACCARLRRRRPRPVRACRGVLRPAHAWLRRCGQIRTRSDRYWNEAAWPRAVFLDACFGDFLAVYGAPQGLRRAMVSLRPGLRQPGSFAFRAQQSRRNIG